MFLPMIMLLCTVNSNPFHKADERLLQADLMTDPIVLAMQSMGPSAMLLGFGHQGLQMVCVSHFDC